MNFERERNSLIDISLEDDFLIDSCLDNLSLDLRLSVACETENELVGSFGHPKQRKHPSMNNNNNAESLIAVQEHTEADPVEKEYISETRSNSLRKSLAWDHAFFTSPGFLEIEELCLVNRGFKNPEVPLSSESQEHTRSKVCIEQSSIHEQGVGVVAGQRTQSLLEPKLTSPSKVNASLECKHKYQTKSTQDFKQQLIDSGRTVVKSPSASKSQKTTKRRESLKSFRTVGHTKVTTVNAKKPPLKTVSKSIAASQRQGTTSCRRAVSSSVSSVSSSHSRFSLISNSDSLDFTPYSSYASDSRATSLLRSPGIKGECLYEPSSPGSGDGQSVVDQNSSKPSSLRLPSQKIGFFDVVSGVPTSSNDQIQPKTRLKNTKPKLVTQPVLSRRVVPSEIAPVSHDSNISVQGRGKRSQQRLEEKENMFHPEDTVIELNIKSSPSSSSSSSKFVGNGSSSSGKHPSKAKRPMQPTMKGSSSTRIPFSIKGSPLKRSAFF